MSASMIPCPVCARHVRDDEVACPFCATALASTVDRGRQAPVTFRGLSRAAVLVAGALSVVGCGGSDASQAAAYGGPPQADPSSGSAVDQAASADAGARPAEPADGTPRYK